MMRDGMDDRRMMRTLTAHAERNGRTFTWFVTTRHWRGWRRIRL
jgi:hypothetical protein